MANSPSDSSLCSPRARRPEGFERLWQSRLILLIGGRRSLLPLPGRRARTEPTRPSLTAVQICLIEARVQTGHHGAVGDWDHLVARYWECYDVLIGDRRAEISAECADVVQNVDERVATGDGDAFHLLVALAEAAPDDDGLAYLGAGPLEDLIRNHSKDAVVIDRVEGWARRSPAFAWRSRASGIRTPSRNTFKHG